METHRTRYHHTSLTRPPPRPPPYPAPRRRVVARTSRSADRSANTGILAASHLPHRQRQRWSRPAGPRSGPHRSPRPEPERPRRRAPHRTQASAEDPSTARSQDAFPEQSAASHHLSRHLGGALREKPHRHRPGSQRRLRRPTPLMAAAEGERGGGGIGVAGGNFPHVASEGDSGVVPCCSSMSPPATRHGLW